jgi:hypothetical protein
MVRFSVNHKWFRNLSISQIIADTMDEMGLKLPPSHVDIADIRRKYHAADRDSDGGKSKDWPRQAALIRWPIRAKQIVGYLLRCETTDPHGW